MNDYIMTHISNIRIGDVIEHNGLDRTVGNKDIRYCSFMGVSIFGDSYHLGYKLVKKKIYKPVKLVQEL